MIEIINGGYSREWKFFAIFLCWGILNNSRWVIFIRCNLSLCVLKCQGSPIVVRDSLWRFPLYFQASRWHTRQVTRGRHCTCCTRVARLEDDFFIDIKHKPWMILANKWQRMKLKRVNETRTPNYIDPHSFSKYKACFLFLEPKTRKIVWILYFFLLIRLFR